MSNKNEQGSMDVKQRNVFDALLHQHSAPNTTSQGLPSSIHAGMCNSSNPIAAVVTNSFLDYSASKGTDLRKAGVGLGQRFCIQAATFKSLADKGNDVPSVKLESSHKSVLDSVGMNVLEKFVAGQDTGHKTILPGSDRGTTGKEGWARESDRIGAKDPLS